MITPTGLQQLTTNTSKEKSDLAQIISQIEEQCHNCKPLSPMNCIEQCEIWKMKNEFLKIGEILGQGNHLPELFNAIKNVRRLKILDILSALPCDIKELQKRLKDYGYYHSCRTIDEYVAPLLKLGLVKKVVNRYAPTLYGKKVNAMFRESNVENALPTHSGCYEESVLIELLRGPKTYEELSRTIPSLSRVIGRLQEERLVARKRLSNHVFYFQTGKIFNEKLSPTERKVLDNVTEEGVSAQKLSRLVCITLRRTYKYLRRLEEKQLVFTRNMPRTYELTVSGKQVAKFLDKLVRFISSVSSISAVSNKANA